MRRIMVPLALLGALVAFVFVVPSGAQTIPPTTTTTSTTAPSLPDLAVTGAVTCANSRYTITWTLSNTSQTTVEFMGGQLSGAATGAVELSPSVINPAGTMTGVSTVAGGTKGAVTLSVSTLLGNLGPADYSGSVQLQGTCVQAAAAPQAQAKATFTG